MGNFFNKKEDVHLWLTTMGLWSNFTINDDLSVDVDGDVDLSGNLGGKIHEKFPTIETNYIPVQFGEIRGNFNCSQNKLTTLFGSPRIVKGNFDCGVNELTTLEGAPEVVEGDFDCRMNKLTDLQYSPLIVGGLFECMFNKLVTFNGISRIIGGDLSCCNNNLKSFDGIPKDISVSGNVYTNFTGKETSKQELLDYVSKLQHDDLCSCVSDHLEVKSKKNKIGSRL